MSLGRTVSIFGLIAIAAAILSVAVGTFAFLRLQEARRIVVDEIDPAQTVSREYLASFIDQGAAIRGFLLSGEERFLDQYEEAQAGQSRAAIAIEHLLPDHPRLRKTFDEADRLAEIWSAEYAVPAIRARRDGAGPRAVALALTLGTVQFKESRTALDIFARDLAKIRLKAREQLNTATQVLIGVLTFGALVIAAAGIGIGAGYKRWVAEPLRQLGADARKVAAGDLSHAVGSPGRKEIADLGVIIEGLRKRTLADLEDVRLGRDELEAEAEKLERSNKHLEQFAYIASHDLQEPLRKVSAFCQLLEQKYAGQLDEKADQYIAFAVDGAQRMQNLVSDLLAFSRVGRDTPPKDQVDTNDTLAAALENLKLLLEETDTTVEHSNLPTVYGAKTLLISLFQNLVENAVKFRRTDVPIRVSIVAKRAYESWEIRVIDNGIGIEDQYADRVFEVFQRLHARNEYPGTGIGLAMCRKIVDYHGGTIRIEPNDAPGTTILITLPGRIGDADRGRTSSQADSHPFS